MIYLIRDYVLYSRIIVMDNIQIGRPVEMNGMLIMHKSWITGSCAYKLYMVNDTCHSSVWID